LSAPPATNTWLSGRREVVTSRPAQCTEEKAVRSETERVRQVYDKMALKYDRQIRFFERILFVGGREWVCSRARGETLEIAVGTGRNLALYPAEVTLTGIELSPAMLEIARTRAKALGRDADLRLGDAQALVHGLPGLDREVVRREGELSRRNGDRSRPARWWRARPFRAPRRHHRPHPPTHHPAHAPVIGGCVRAVTPRP
jgi:SAM-dependent methyltransferase